MAFQKNGLSFITTLKSQWQIITLCMSLTALIFFIILYYLHPKFADVPLWVAIIAGGIPSCLHIVVKLCKGDLGADTLAAIAIITSVLLNEYFTATLIILMLSSGETLESFATKKASSALLALVERMPSIAHRKQGQQIEDISLSQIKVGDQIVIYPHEVAPVDGIVIEGHSSMDESYLTGEPYVISKIAGSEILSGAINGESVLTIESTQLPSDSRYAAIVAVLKEAEQKRPTLRRLGDQIGAVFAPIALLSACAAWYFTGDTLRFLSVLVIATPCPLLIAIPITLISAISLAAKHAIIIKDPTVLERLPTCKTAIFDKTGTLTYGKPVLTKVITEQEYDENFILIQTASLERYSKHPLALAILNAAREKKLALRNASEVSEKPGHGLSGVIDGHSIVITHRKKFQELNPELSSLLPPVVSGLECIVLYDNRYAATLQFRDLPRDETQSFISHLQPKHNFQKIMLLSGDRENEVNYLGKLLNISEIYASQTPAQKVAVVRAETQNAPTLFMGDGINDAPALTAATVGIAFGQHSNVTAEAAGAVIMDNNLNKVDELLHLCLRTRSIALQSAVGGMLFSIVGMGFAAAGFISPPIGAILQELIDIVAIVNALRVGFTLRSDDSLNNK